GPGRLAALASVPAGARDEVATTFRDGTHRSRVADIGLRTALFFTRTHARVLCPGLASVLPRPPSTAALRRAFHALETVTRGAPTRNAPHETWLIHYRLGGSRPLRVCASSLASALHERSAPPPLSDHLPDEPEFHVQTQLGSRRDGRVIRRPAWSNALDAAAPKRGYLASSHHPTRPPTRAGAARRRCLEPTDAAHDEMIGRKRHGELQRRCFHQLRAH